MKPILILWIAITLIAIRYEYNKMDELTDERIDQIEEERKLNEFIR